MKRILICMIAALAVVSCTEEQEIGQVERVAAVVAEVVTLSNRDIVTTFTGNLKGEQQADIYSKLSEAVTEIKFEEGDRVKAGQILMSLDPDGPTVRYHEARSFYLNAEKNSGKMKHLFDEGAISESQYDAAQTEYEVRKAAFEAVERLVSVRIPISGVVTSIDVSPGDQVHVGQKLASVATVGKLRVEFGVNSSDIDLFEIGLPVSVSGHAIEQTIHGVVSSIPQSADRSTRSYRVEAILDNTNGAFSPEMFVKIELISEQLSDVIVVPRDVVMLLDEAEIVYIVANGVAVVRQVALGSGVGGEVVITSGLMPGDTLVTMGQDYLEDGIKVNLTRLDGADL